MFIVSDSSLSVCLISSSLSSLVGVIPTLTPEKILKQTFEFYLGLHAHNTHALWADKNVTHENIHTWFHCWALNLPVPSLKLMCPVTAYTEEAQCTPKGVVLSKNVHSFSIFTMTFFALTMWNIHKSKSLKYDENSHLQFSSNFLTQAFLCLWYDNLFAYYVLSWGYAIEKNQSNPNWVAML